ncbi:hypothetical protein HELRODRAFT_168156 [Helobdella robusta]|uniref:Ribonuclease H2 subunit B n=1 Tax=Helobdella robusta TaxID=6412 RepID=T1F085_HELRO|nr:hypothetical protein HELRODRAFT_168156 [Helobdella robusta]ESO09197.1 hypothetical protein HELRODRAFT_168156 [Helobdella robusta]
MYQDGPIILLEDVISQNNGILETCKLKHPKTGIASTFFYSNSSCHIYEITKFQENFRSWFIKDFVVKGGEDGLFMVTEINMLYLFLPLLRKSFRMYKSVGSILDDENFPDNKIFQDKLMSFLKFVCDTKELGEDLYYKYNKEKTLAWLQLKVIIKSMLVIYCQNILSQNCPKNY